jgi:hypothetical protein
MKPLAVIVTAIVSLACGSDTTRPIDLSTVNGLWVGTVVTTTVSAATTVSLSLRTSGDTVTGNSELSQDRGMFSVEGTVTGGVYTPPNLSLIIASIGFQPLQFAGVRSGDSLTGTLNGQGLTNQPITLIKQ